MKYSEEDWGKLGPYELFNDEEGKTWYYWNFPGQYIIMIYVQHGRLRQLCLSFYNAEEVEDFEKSLSKSVLETGYAMSRDKFRYRCYNKINIPLSITINFKANVVVLSE